MKWIGILLAASVSVTATSSWAGACLDNIKQKGVLLAGNGLMGTKPFVWKNEDGTYGGFEWEIFQLGNAWVRTKITVGHADRVKRTWEYLSPVRHQRVRPGYSVRPIFYCRIFVSDGAIVDLKGRCGSTLGPNDTHRHACGTARPRARLKPFAALVALEKDGRPHPGQGTPDWPRETGRFRSWATHNKPKPEWADAEAKSPYVFGAIAVGVRRECPDLLAAVNKGLESMDADGTRKAILEKYGMWADYVAKLMK